MYTLKYIFIGLLEVVPFHVHRQISNKFPFFLVVKIFPQTSRLLNIVTYLPRQLLRKLVFIIKLSKYLRTLTPLCVFGSNLLNNTSNAVNVIGKSHTTKGLNKHQTNSLFEIVSHDVSKTNSEHDRVGPVVRPTVLLVPWSKLYLLISHPIRSWVEVRHSCEQDGDDVCEREIEKEYLNEGPILLVV